MTEHDLSLSRLREAVPDAALRVPAVSAWSVGMQVHHCALAMIGVCDALAAAGDAPPPGRMTPIGRLVLLTGRIPRGRGKSPAAAVPPPEIPEAEILARLDEAEARVRAAAGLPGSAWFRHHVFGVLDRNRTLRFLRIHNGHHLRIVRDIRKAAGRA